MEIVECFFWEDYCNILDINNESTGETWFGRGALECKLCNKNQNQISTKGEYKKWGLIQQQQKGEYKKPMVKDSTKIIYIATKKCIDQLYITRNCLQ